MRILKAVLITFSVAIFWLSIAPFTPAVLAAPILMLTGIALCFSTAKATGAITTYWAASAVLVSPINGFFPFDSGYFFLPTVLAGICLMVYLYLKPRLLNASPNVKLERTD